MLKDWGICEKCGKPATCERYSVEIGEKEASVCEPCFFDLREVVKAWFGRDRNRRLALEAFRKVLGAAYPARWVDGRTSKGDFSGRDVAVDVFNVPVKDQRGLLRSLREVRDLANALVGSRCLFIFHTPEATAEHYKDIVAELAKL